jgi:hypothetical protein
MEKDDIYYFHQTPPDLAKDLLALLNLDATDRLYEPFKGEGAFYNNFPASNPKDWSEITDGRDYKDYTGEYDWVITNPPFRLNTEGVRVNAFWFLLDYFANHAKKGIAFLSNDSCLASLTPKRIKSLNDRGWYIHSFTVCAVKRWRGRYYFVVLEKKQSDMVKCLVNAY